MFDILLPLNRLICRVVDFEIHETIYSVLLRMPIDHLLFVLVHAADKIVGNAH